MFNGEAKSGHGGKGNYVKAFKTQGGNAFEIDDTNEHEKIRVHDKAQNKFEIDIATNTITVSANYTVNMNAENINLNAEKNIHLQAGNRIQVTSSENIEITANNTLDIFGKKNRMGSQTANARIWR